MDKKTIKEQLLEHHHTFVGFVSGLSDTQYITSANEKWAAGQQLEHIYLSVRPVRLALSLPKFILKIFWGRANRKSRSYDELVKKYLHKLEAGGKATKQFIPKKVTAGQRKKLEGVMLGEASKLCRKMNRFTEPELDIYILPHPLLGKLTLREMLYFTIYHVQHHHKQTKQNLEA